MKIQDAIKRSLLAYVIAKHDPQATAVTGYERMIYRGGEYPTRIYYTHSGPTNEIRSVLFDGTIPEMFEKLDLDLMVES